MPHDHEESGSKRDPKGRFLKNRPSPNPGGRPPKRASSDGLFATLDPLVALVIKLTRKTVRHTRDGEEMELSKIEVAFEKLFSMAVRGDMSAMKLYLAIADRAASAEKQHRERFAAVALAYKEYWLPIFDQCERQRKPTPRQYPHPRDIEIYADGSVKIHGPADQEGHEVVLAAATRRDHLQAGLEALLNRPSLNGTSPDGGALESKILREFRKINKLLPPRLRVADNFTSLKRVRTNHDPQPDGQR